MNALVQDPAAILRRATLADVEFIIGLGRRAYPDTPIHLGLPWLLECLKRTDHLCVVSGYGFGVCSLRIRYGQIKETQLDILAIEPGRGMHIVRFVRAMVGWSKAGGAEVMRMGSSTGVDFGPVAKRMGGVVSSPSYFIPLKEKQDG